jgi:hypothetical protein
VTNPYRGQLISPSDRAHTPLETGFRSPPGAGIGALPTLPAGLSHEGQVRTPAAATWAAVASVVTGCALGVFGVLLLLVLSIQAAQSPDRSLYAGRDTAYALLAVIDLVIGLVLAVGGVSLLGGSVCGRIAVTIGASVTLGLSAFWYLQHTVPALIPALVATIAAGVLLLSYRPIVTAWLGVLLSPQPE